MNLQRKFCCVFIELVVMCGFEVIGFVLEHLLATEGTSNWSLQSLGRKDARLVPRMEMTRYIFFYEPSVCSLRSANRTSELFTEPAKWPTVESYFSAKLMNVLRNGLKGYTY